MADNKVNVGFKRGSSANLVAAKGTYEDGVFYLTTDTDRLYVGKDSTTLAELNRYVKVVQDIDALNAITSPAEDDFVYIKDKNILAICINPTATEVEDRWMQINPDTNTDTNDVFEITDFSAVML